MKYSLIVLIVCVAIVATGCTSRLSETYRYSLDAPELLSFSDMYEIDREQFCLTEIDKNATVEVERDEYGTRGYHAMLYIYRGNVSRTVAFVEENNQYVWIGEQEIHRSGRKFMTVDGEVEEYISITYYKRKIDGYNRTGLDIIYNGDYQFVNLPRSFDLTCEQVQPYIKEWNRKNSSPTPG
jgi:hypothetical protein